jgi:hypothetical protein
MCANGKWNGPNSLLNESEGDAQNRLVAALLLKPAPAGTETQAANDCLVSLEKRWLELQIREQRKRLTQQGLSVVEIAKIQHQVLDLRASLDNIGRSLRGKPLPGR